MKSTEQNYMDSYVDYTTIRPEMQCKYICIWILYGDIHNFPQNIRLHR